MESSAGEQEVPAGASFEGSDSFRDNVSSISAARRDRAVNEVVKAYFDALVLEDVPDELETLVMGLR